ncbi:FAD-dependent monooxygenase [Nocardia sp. NPDC059240]|uniref:FAD-dependent monooxygenase n=1 Tax=Nocardia sp. NPDC059240 TaxID=3346786 RepID=UPI0036A9825E
MRTSVLIVGGGPVGLTLSILLSRMGIDHRVIEARTEPSPHPKARGISARSMEIFRRVGLEAEIRAAGLPAEHVAFFRGRTLDDPDYVRTTPDSQGTEHTPTPGVLCSQDALERVLSARAGDRVRRGVRLVSFEQSDSGVVATVREERTGIESVVRADWLIGCDGAHSTVREGSGIAMTGASGLGEFLSVRFEAPLGAVVADRVSASYFLARGGGFLAVDNDRQWIFQHPLEGEQPSELDVIELIRSGSGRADLDVTIRSTAVWRVNARLADAYRSGRVLLAGDAAHGIPPTGGHGMNVGIGDADNLAWKIAAVLTGKADESLLGTYESERRPVARQVIDISTANSRNRAGYRIDDELLLGTAYRDSGTLLATDGYVPSGEPGDRLPHAWLPDGRSTLDLVGLDPGGSGYVLLTGSELPQGLRDSCGLSPAAALLVRPDGHIAARVRD